MNSNNRIPFLLLGLLLLVGIATWLITYAHPASVPLPNHSPATPLHTYLVDVAGWYEITPNERAVTSPFDLSIGGTNALPPQIGNWQSEPYPLGSEIDEWFENPDLALSSIYRDDRGHQVWFSTFGSHGSKSYFLFEHTPITSYPAAGWTVLDSGVAPIEIGERTMYTQKTTLALGDERRVVYYWYLWPNFDRDPEKGVLSIRLHVPIISSVQDASEAAADFIRSLFPQVMTWRRF